MNKSTSTHAANELAAVRDRVYASPLPDHWSAVERVSYWSGVDAAFEAMLATVDER